MQQKVVKYYYIMPLPLLHVIIYWRILFNMWNSPVTVPNVIWLILWITPLIQDVTSAYIRESEDGSSERFVYVEFAPCIQGVMCIFHIFPIRLRGICNTFVSVHSVKVEVSLTNLLIDYLLFVKLAFKVYQKQEENKEQGNWRKAVWLYTIRIGLYYRTLNFAEAKVVDRILTTFISVNFYHF